MKVLKKMVALTLGFALFTGVFTGCGSNNKESATKDSVSSTQASTAVENDYKENMKISVAFWSVDDSVAKISQDKIAQDILNKFNVTIKPVNITWDDYVQKIQMWAASNQLPDVFSIDAIGTQYYRNWVSQGLVKPLSEDMSKYPNLAEIFKDPDIKGLNENGKFYCIPRKLYPSIDWSGLDRIVMYRWDLAQKAGITREPETWDEFKAMLKAIIDKDPEGKKIKGLTAGNVKQIGGLFWLYGNPAATSDGSGSDFKWIKEDGKYVPAVFSKGALAAVKNMREMYTSGLIDPDIALTKLDVAGDKFVDGKVAAMLISGGFVNYDSEIYAKRWEKANPGVDITSCIKVLKPLAGPDGQRYHAVFKTYWSESYISAKVDDKKTDRILRLYDYIYSPEGIERLTFGEKDVDYKVEGGKKVILEKQSLGIKYPACNFLRNLVTFESNAYTMECPVITNPKIRQEAVDYIDWVIKNSKVPKYEIKLTYMSTPTKDKFSILDHDDLLTVMLSKEQIETAWGNIVNSYKDKGLDKMIEEVNAKANEMGIN